MPSYTDSSYAASLRGPRRSSSKCTSSGYHRGRTELGMMSTQTFATERVWKRQTPDRDPRKPYKRRSTISQGSRKPATKEPEDDEITPRRRLRWRSGRRSSMPMEEQRRLIELGMSRQASVNGVSKSATSSSRGVKPNEKGSVESNQRQCSSEPSLATKDDSTPGGDSKQSGRRYKLRR